MPNWIANLATIATMYATIAPLLVGVYWIGDHTGWRPEWHWEAEQRAWYDKSSYLKYRILEARERNPNLPDDPKLVGVYCGLSQAVKVDTDPSIHC